MKIFFFDFLFQGSLLYESNTMKSILYVAVFVACMFILSGMLKTRTTKQAVRLDLEEFFSYLAASDFASFHHKYPTFIQFNHFADRVAPQRIETVLYQQQAAFEQAIQIFNFKNLADTIIERIRHQPFQYGRRMLIVVTGRLLYQDGSQKYFRAVFQQHQMYSLDIEGVCVLNERCHRS